MRGHSASYATYDGELFMGRCSARCAEAYRGDDRISARDADAASAR